MDSLTDISDADLVREAGQGDRAAFAELLGRHLPLALRLSVRMLRDQALSEEAVQEAAIQAFTSLDRLREPASFGPWLCGIAMNVSRDLLRANSRSLLSLEEIAGGVRLDALLMTDGGDADPARVAEVKEMDAAIRRGIQALPGGQREACLLFYIEERSLREVAADLGISINAVKARLHKGRAGLRERLQIERAPTGSASGKLSRPDRQADQLGIKVPDTRDRADKPLEAQEMIKVRVLDVIRHQWEREDDPTWTNPRHTVVLLDDENRRVLPIWIGRAEGIAITTGLRQVAFPRPQTTTFAVNLLSAMAAQVDQVRIDKLEGSTFFAAVVLNADGQRKEIDARPSDAIALAVHTGSPIYVAENVMGAEGISAPEGWSPESRSTSGLEEILEEVEKVLQPGPPKIPGDPTVVDEGKRRVREAIFGSGG